MHEWYVKNRLKNSRYENKFTDDEQDSVSHQKIIDTKQPKENDKSYLTHQIPDSRFEKKLTEDDKSKTLMNVSKEITQSNIFCKIIAYF